MGPRLYLLLLKIAVAISTIAFFLAYEMDAYGGVALGAMVFLFPIAVGLFWVVVRRILRKRLSDCLPGLFLSLVAVGGLCYAMAMGCSDPSPLWWPTRCGHNLRAVGIALHSYHYEYGSLPPAYVAGANGKPMHSWRVLILPFLDQPYNSVYESYDFTQPWDSPTNRRLIDNEPSEYVCPADEYACRHEERPPGLTSYVAVVGQKAPWKGAEPVDLRSMKDGTTKTIIVVDAANSNIPWTEPRDLRWEELRSALNSQTGMSLSGKHWMPRGLFWKATPAPVFQCLFGDGSVRCVPLWDLTPDLLEKTLTIGSGGYDEEAFGRRAWPTAEWDWWNCSVFGVWVVSVYLLLRRLRHIRRKNADPS